MRTGNLTIAIVDDEALARERLRLMIADIGGWDVVAEAANGREALVCCEERNPDVVLLDIRMPGLDGMDVANQLAKMQLAPIVVFTTAFDEYAVSAFDAEAVAYLLKPVRRERLLQALARAAKTCRMLKTDWRENNSKSGPRNVIPVSLSGAITLVDVEQITSFHADQKYVRIVHKDGESLIDGALKQLEQEFVETFVRIHRNSLVRPECIARCEANEAGQLFVHMRDGNSVYPVSRRLAAALKQLLRKLS
jgi:two-component system response regulator AlgR